MARQVLFRQRQASKQSYLLDGGLYLRHFAHIRKLAPSPVLAMSTAEGGGDLFSGGYGT